MVSIRDRMMVGLGASPLRGCVLPSRDWETLRELDDGIAAVTPGIPLARAISEAITWWHCGHEDGTETGR